MSGKNAAAGIVIIVVIIALAAVVLTTQKPSQIATTTTVSSPSGQSYASMLLTDPPQVPTGTSALIVQYSSIAVHSPATNGWITSNTTGSVNLLTLINTTQVLGNINLSTNTTIDMARFFVSSAQITINGTTYNVTVPSGQITAQLTTPSKVNGVTSVLVQLSPTVVTIYTNTTPVFILVPSVRAITIGNASARVPPHIGGRASLNASERRNLDEIAPNITITAASLAQVNGSTTVSVTVKDNSNFSATLMHIGVKGKENVSINASAANNIANAIINRTDELLTRIQNETEHENASVRVNVSVSANESQNKSRGKNRTTDSSGQTNFTGIDRNSGEIGDISGNASVSAFVRAAVANGTVNTTAFRTALIQKVRESLSAHLNNSEAFQNDNRILLFQIAANGTIQLPLREDQFSGEFGYNLSAGQSHTFTFSGPISLANGKLEISLIAGGNYTIGVQGQRDTRASVNVTAT